MRTVHFLPRPPAVPFRNPNRQRLGRLGDTCAVVGATATSTPVTAPLPVNRNTQPIRSGGMKGLARLGVNTGTGGAALTAVGVTGKGGASGAVTGAAKGASVGASAGSIVPGVGTAIGAAIGAVVGAVAGALIHTSDFPEWLANDANIVKVLQQLPAGFQGRSLPLQTPTQANPITLEMIWTAIVVTQNMYAYVSPNPGHSPSDMQNEFNWVIAWMTSIVKCMNQHPIGTKLNMSVTVGNGVTFTLAFTNPGSASSATVANNVMIPAYLAWCTHNGKVDTQSNHCPGDAANPLNRLVLTLMTDWVIAQNPPPASQAAAPAAVVAAPKTATVVPAKTATVTVATPKASTTVTAGKAVTTIAPTTATPAAATSTPILYYLLNGDLDSGTTLPSGAIPITQAQYTLMLTQPSTAAAQQLYDALMGGTPTAATTPGVSTPQIITVPGSSEPVQVTTTSDNTWVYALVGLAAVFLFTRSQKRQ